MRRVRAALCVPAPSHGLTTQGGLGLPDRDYYFDEDKEAKRALYASHVARVLGLMGESEEEAKRGAEAVLRLETALAAAHLTRTERRDPETTYNRMAPAKLAALCKGGAAAGGIDWPRHRPRLGGPVRALLP